MDWNLTAAAVGAVAGLGTFGLEALGRFRPTARSGQQSSEPPGQEANQTAANWAFASAIALVVCSTLFIVAQRLLSPDDDGSRDLAGNFAWWAVLFAVLTIGTGAAAWWSAIMRHTGKGWERRRIISERGRAIGALLLLVGFVLLVLIAAFIAAETA